MVPNAQAAQKCIEPSREPASATALYFEILCHAHLPQRCAPRKVRATQNFEI